MDAPPDRRPGVDLVGLPARRDRLHRGRRRRRSLLLTADGRVRAAGRRLGRRRGQPVDAVALGPAIPADRRRDPRVRARFGCDAAGPAVWNTDDAPRPDHPAATRPTRGTTTGGPSRTTRSTEQLEPSTTTTDRRGRRRAARSSTGSPTIPTRRGPKTFTFTVTPAKFTARPWSRRRRRSRSTRTSGLTTVGQAGYFATLDRDGGSGAIQRHGRWSRSTATTRVSSTSRRCAAPGRPIPTTSRRCTWQVAPGLHRTDGTGLEAKILASGRSRHAVRHRAGRWSRSSSRATSRTTPTCVIWTARGLITVECFADATSAASASTTPRPWR